MNGREFFSLAAILVFEILIAHGMVFVFEEAKPDFKDEEIGLLADANSEPQPESKPDFFASEVGLLPAPDPSPHFSAQVPQSEPSPPPIEIRNIALTPQGQLAHPPEIIKAVYLTSWSGGSASRIDYVLRLAKTTELNAVVLDIKDFSGEIAYRTDVPEVKRYGAERIKIGHVETLLKRLHEEGLYVIARITVFQDPVLVRARPSLAVQSLKQEGIWADYKGLGWVDPASLEVWNYTVAIARDAASRGFDEINFDYVRFPSDGDLQDMQFPFWDGQTPRRVILRNFFAYLREHLPDIAISADLFGLSTSSRDDLGIGQVLEDALEYFDYVYPMVYPSHYANGYQGYGEPATYPYEVVHYSMASAQARLAALRAAKPPADGGRQFARLRPWLQDFDLGATYDALMVQAQAQAAQDALGEEFSGFLLWAPTNYYTTEALKPFVFNKASYQNRFLAPAPNP